MKTKSIYLITILALLPGLSVQENPLVKILRSLGKVLSGEDDGSSGLDFEVLKKLPIPPDFIPDEFKSIQKRHCEGEVPRRCQCEPGAELETISFPPDHDHDKANLESVIKVFKKCRPV